MKEISYSLAAKAVDEVFRANRAAGHSKSSLAEALGISRPTLDSRLSEGDMKLTEFLKMAGMAGVKPSKAIACCDSIVTTEAS